MFLNINFANCTEHENNRIGKKHKFHFFLIYEQLREQDKNFKNIEINASFYSKHKNKEETKHIS